MENILENINVVLTRAKNQSVETINQLEDLGAKVLSFPTIKISTIVGDKNLDETIRNIKKFNSLIFTSENAVKALMDKIEELDMAFDPKAFFVISIGGKTSQTCREFGFRIDFQSKLFTSEKLIKELNYIDLIGRNILVPNSTLSKKNQFASLEEYGAKIEEISIYRNTTNDIESLSNEIGFLNKSNIDLFIFTSPSTYSGYLEIFNIDKPAKYFDNKNIAVIGPVTKTALLKTGIEPNIMPQNFTMNYLIEEIKNFYSDEKIIS